MQEWLLIVETNCNDEKRESEFNRWYDTIHIPDVVNDTPGFKKATRYVIRDPKKGKGKYLAVYEIETDDIKKTMEAHARVVQSKRAAGRWTELVEIVSRRICKAEHV